MGDEDLADSGSGGVFETERLYFVLVDVGKGDTTALNGFDTSEFLQAIVETGRGMYERCRSELLQ